MDLTMKQMRWLLVLLAVVTMYLLIRDVCRSGLGFGFMKEGMSGGADIQQLVNMIAQKPQPIYDFVKALNDKSEIELPSNVKINGTLQTSGAATIQSAYIGQLTNYPRWAMFTHKDRTSGDNYAFLAGNHGGNIINASRKMYNEDGKHKVDGSDKHGDSGTTKIRIDNGNSKTKTKRSSLILNDCIEANQYRAFDRFYTHNKDKPAVVGSVLGHDFFLIKNDAGDADYIKMNSKGDIRIARKLTAGDVHVSGAVKADTRVQTDKIYVENEILNKPHGVPDGHLSKYLVAHSPDYFELPL